MKNIYVLDKKNGFCKRKDKGVNQNEKIKKIISVLLTMGLLLVSTMPAYAEDQLGKNTTVRDQPIMVEPDVHLNQVALENSYYKIKGQFKSEQAYTQEVKNLMQKYSAETNLDLSVTNENISPEMIQNFVEKQVQDGIIEFCRRGYESRGYRAIHVYISHEEIY